MLAVVLVLGALMILVTRPLLSALGQDPDVIEIARDFNIMFFPS